MGGFAMGRLWWRERWSVLGCRRGWIRIASLAALAIGGYLALYTWLRGTDEIRVACVDYQYYDQEGTLCHVVSISPAAQAGRDPSFRQHMSSDHDHGTAEVAWPWSAAVWWPAMRLEIALDRHGWSPWGGWVTRHYPGR